MPFVSYHAELRGAQAVHGFVVLRSLHYILFFQSTIWLIELSKLWGKNRFTLAYDYKLLYEMRILLQTDFKFNLSCTWNKKLVDSLLAVQNNGF